MKHSFSFRNLFLVIAMISSLLLTACGGGGGGGGGGKGVNEAMVGTWYLNFEDGKPVVPNSKGQVDSMTLKADGSCTMKSFDLTNYGHPTYWEIEGSGETDKGTWSYADGRLYVKIDGEENSVPVSLDNGKLTLTCSYEDSNETYTSVYKKTKYGDDEDSGGGSSQPVSPTNPTSITKNDLVGTWYLNYEDGKPVHTNSKGEVSSMILKSDGTCIMKDFDLTDYGHSTYWEQEATVYNDTGTWSYSNGKLTTKIDGYTMTISVTLKDGALTLNGTEPEPWTSVYKKTKYGQ
jgi:hypothetical protein